MVIVLIAAAKLLGGRSTPWWTPAYSKKGGKGAGSGATSAPVPQGGALVWSEATMRLFVKEMRVFGIDPGVALLGVAAASNFNSDEALGGYVGLLMVARTDLTSIGYPGVPPFEELDAPAQIPWLAKVIGYRIASTGGQPPRNVGELAALLHPAENPTIADVIRREAERRAADAQGTALYIHHKTLLTHVLSGNP